MGQGKSKSNDPKYVRRDEARWQSLTCGSRALQSEQVEKFLAEEASKARRHFKILILGAARLC